VGKAKFSHSPFLSKGCSFDDISDDTVAAIENWIKAFLEKSSIIALLMKFLKVSYLILQFRENKKNVNIR
jgi:hypothetical protein